MEERKDFKFDVFISYRHSEVDSAVAGYLQKSLEHYRIPREIQKKCGKKKISRVFRDEEELGVASDLFNEIEENLKQSEFLLVICSPRFKESKWCMREIDTFLKYRSRDNVLAVLVEGDPEESFPPQLLEDGEPLAADLRGKDKREVLRHARQRMPRLVAPLIYCTYDELYQRHRVYRMRRLAAAAALVSAVSLSFGAVTVRQNQKITENYTAKLENQSRYLAQTAQNLLKQGDREAALLVAKEALPKGSEDNSRPYVAEARIALESALYTYTKDFQFNLKPQKVLEHQQMLTACTDYSEEENVLLTTDGSVYIWDGVTGENICHWEDEGIKYARLTGSHTVTVQKEQTLYCFDYRTKEILWTWELPACGNSYCIQNLIWSYSAATGKILCANKEIKLEMDYLTGESTLYDAHRFHLIDVSTGESTLWEPRALYENQEQGITPTIIRMEVSPNGQRLALQTQIWENGGYERCVYVLDLARPDFAMVQPWEDTDIDTRIRNLTWVDDASFVTVETDPSANLLGLMGREAVWTATRWDAESGEALISHEDVCMSLNGNVHVQAISGTADGIGDMTLLSITFDNVVVNLDADTGYRYSRIEDRSPIVLNHIWDVNGPEMIVTADGYVFITYPLQDSVWYADTTMYHYYLDLDTILKARFHNKKTYLYTDTAVYCYSGAVDRDYIELEGRASAFQFSEDSAYVLSTQTNGTQTLSTTEEGEVLWQQSGLRSSSGRTSALLKGGYAACLSADAAAVQVYDISSGTETTIPLEGQLAADQWMLRAAGTDRVLVWSTKNMRVDAESRKEEELCCGAVWLVDVAGGSVVRQWTWQELLDQLTVSEDCYSAGMFHYEPAMTADGSRMFLAGVLHETHMVRDANGLAVDMEDHATPFALIWDLTEDHCTALVEEVARQIDTEMGFASWFGEDGWLSPTGENAIFYDSEKKVLHVVDLAQNAVLHSLPVEGIGSSEVSFTPDGDHIIFQDGGLHLRVYHWKEGVYTMVNTIPEEGSMSFSFHQDGSVLSAMVKVTYFLSQLDKIYTNLGDGTFKHETTISFAGACDGTHVLVKDDYSARIYRMYGLDDLLAKAEEVLQGRELTEVERKSYLID